MYYCVCIDRDDTCESEVARFVHVPAVVQDVGVESRPVRRPAVKESLHLALNVIGAQAAGRVVTAVVLDHVEVEEDVHLAENRRRPGGDVLECVGIQQFGTTV